MFGSSEEIMFSCVAGRGVWEVGKLVFSFLLEKDPSLLAGN